MPTLALEQSIDPQSGNAVMKYKTSLWYYHNDPAYKEKSIKRVMEQRKDPDARKKEIQKSSERYKTDPEFRQKRLEANRKYYQKQKAMKEQAANASSTQVA